ncbi:MAG TPA: TadE/TadG family type IV pilus assembly protein [Chloroflexota bacterium]|nr:TadE/TadG family type IV pilus assembly protein [Chloroflexota bacterium]
MRMRWRTEDGSAAAELAILGPLFAILIAGLVEGAGLVQTVQVVRNAAREGARYAAVSDGTAGAKATAYLTSTFGSRTDVTSPTASCTSPAPAVGTATTCTAGITLNISAPVIQNILGSSMPISASATMKVTQ